MEKLYPLTDEELRKVQLEELEILKYVKKICDEHRINYFLDWGTLLGAVRHQGFIPWDNDIDIGMLRDDYEKFCKVFPNDEDNKYILQNWNTDANWPLPYSKVRKKNTVFITNHIENNQTEGFCGFNIDIFVYDNITNDIKVISRMDKKLKSIQRLLFMKSGYRPWYRGDNYSVIKRILYFPFQILSLFYGKDKLIELSELKAKSVYDDKYVFYHAGTDDIQVFERELLSNLIELVFEGENFKCPRNYDAILSKQYGEYMKLPPEEVRSQRSYVLKMIF